MLHHKKNRCCGMLHRVSDLDSLFGITSAVEYGNEIWNVKEFL
jgi:hypothetical protein